MLVWQGTGWSAIGGGGGGNGDVRCVVNREGAGDTASFLFQTGFSGRAEFGLISSDAFGLKVSPDGSSFSGVPISPRQP